MRFFNQLSIKIKLVLIVLAVSLPVLVLFALYNIMANVSSSKDRLKNEIESVAKMTAEYIRPFLIFNDDASTEQLLQFNQIESIEYACVYNTEGKIVSQYKKEASSSSDSSHILDLDEIIIPFKPANTSKYNGRFLHTYTNASWEGETIGTLYLIANTKELQHLQRQIINNTIFAVLLAIVLTLILVFLFRGYITKPILALATLTENIAQKSDYSQRINNEYFDEIGTLYTNFNALLDKVESTTVSRGYLDDILSSMAEMLFVLDNNDYKIQKINDAVTQQMGYTIRDLLGQKIDVLLRKKTNESCYVKEEIIDNFYTKSGECKIISISLSRLKNQEEGKPSFLICTARDITEKELAKKKLRQNIEKLEKTQADLKVAKELAEASVKAKSEFLSKMSHEIRTPMNAIMGMAHLLLQNNPPLEQRHDLETLLLSSQNLLALINNILDFSQIETGDILFKKTIFDLHNFVKKIVQTHETVAVGIQLSIGKNVPINVIQDEKRLSQVLTNLIDNAVKFTKQGKVKFFVNLIEEKEKESLIEFIVSDTGIGIPKDKLNLIFESFSQVDNSLTREFQGKGLGLSVVKHLLELQGSSIKLQSTLNKGSDFSFVLAFENVTKQPLSTKEVSKITTPPIEIDDRLSGMNILLVEDNKMNILVTKKLLSLWKVNVVDVAVNGKIGVEYAEKNNYDVILMDLQMPVMNGFEAATNIRQLPQHLHTPIIALTAEVREESQSKAILAGMNDYIAKPFKPSTLFQAISQFITTEA